MRNLIRAVALVPFCGSLTACAGVDWLPSFLQQERPMLQAQLVPEPAPRIIPANFTQTVPITTVAAVPALPAVKPKAATQPKKKSPTARVSAANSAALQEPSLDGYVNAVQIYNYANGSLYRLYAAPQTVSDIALQPGERLTAISAGDTTRWVVGDTTSGSGATKQVHVLVKPFASGLRTNLVITTDRRTYHMELQSTPDTYMTAVSWTYPEDALVKQGTVVAAAPSPLDGLPNLENLHFDYAISGDNVLWRPVRAFDDGTRVYIEFPPALSQGDAPPLFVQGPNGGQDLVNYRVRGTFYVVDQLFNTAELRLGQERQQVVRIKRTSPPRTAQSSTASVR